MAVPNGLNPTFYSVNTLNGFTVNDVTVIDSTGAIIAPVSLSLGDDDILTAGTTTTTAATKVTLEFDKTGTGIGQFKMGDLSNPQVLITNPGSTVVADTINILHSAGAGDCDDLLGRYTKVHVKGSGDSGMTVAVDAPRAYVGLTGGSNNSVVSQAYASQPWFSHEGTGAITAGSALSAKCDVGADAFTATTVNAGHFHIEGAATVTSSMFDGVMIEIYPDVTCLDAGLRIVTDTGAVSSNALSISGAYSTTGISITGTAPTSISVTGGSGASTRAFKGAVTVNNANYGDGYGLVESELTLTGTVAGHVSALTSWVNIITGTTGSNMICAQSNGVYEEATGTLTNSTVIFGMRMQSLLAEAPSESFPFSCVSNTNVITALFSCNAGSSDMGTVTDAGSDSGKLVPLYKETSTGTTYYVKLYAHT